MKKICQFIVNNKQPYLVQNNVYKIKDVSLGETTFAMQNILTSKINYHIDIVPFFIDRYICAAMQE
jgi:hypothetical protein